ncbi:MAG: VWA domain-containing protein [Candidatus Tectomicrobia bacterium]|uniref:VWA domain-containing protein n=1 Tax=Tectimicrobiota bacterium TaxID=2528274 RepID=A0A932CLS4_UNCTE|nr:VWA domain-containing protein [Candidatus Tectomicrobia bacterium]
MKGKAALFWRPGRTSVSTAVILAALVLAGVTGTLAVKPGPRVKPGPTPASTQAVSEGSLIGFDADGRRQDFPLKHTAVTVEIAGFLARVQVTQQFENPYPDKIEAVYTCPLPQRAAVDDMTLRVGDRVVRGKIQRREEAQAIYQAARAKGHVAGLLDQERPNIFTQSVANILPGERVTVSIRYVETLQYEDGSYELVFPMVVGPRYIPGRPTGRQGGGWAEDTDQIPDASRITPPVTPPGTRAGHDLSLEVRLEAGLPIESLRSPSHEIRVERPAASQAVVRLKAQTVIPNQDFILRYDVAGRQIEDAVLTHRNGQEGFFMLLLQPPDRVTPEEVTPKELVFVVDTSGSMSGFPIEKAKETMRLALDGLYPQDTFNLITFSGDTRVLFPEPVPATPENLRKAQAFLASQSGGGGTEMMQAIRTALDPSDAQDHLRIVCFMTDGYVGNDFAILEEIRRHPNARVFAFGIGSSVNRFLLDGMAEHGRGEVEYVGLNDDGSAAARRFHERVRNPLLTDLSVDWGGLPVKEVYPKRLPDLFSAKPVVLTGRYTAAGRGIVRLRGRLAGRAVTREIHLNLPAVEPKHGVLATLWARTRVADIMSQDFDGMQQGNPRTEVREAITRLGLDHRLVTQFTSFVAVEEMMITEGGAPRRVEVPVEMPEGVSYEGVFGLEDAAPSGIGQRAISPSPAAGGFSGRKERPSYAPAERSVAALPETQELAMEPPSSGPAKLHPTLTAVVERVKNRDTKPTAAEASFVKKGQALIQVWLRDTSPETMARLKKLGFELVLQPKTANLVIGRLPIDKLAELAALDVVRYVAPQLTRL